MKEEMINTQKPQTSQPKNISKSEILSKMEFTEITEITEITELKLVPKSLDLFTYKKTRNGAIHRNHRNHGNH